MMSGGPGWSGQRPNQQRLHNKDLDLILGGGQANAIFIKECYDKFLGSSFLKKQCCRRTKKKNGGLK